MEIEITEECVGILYRCIPPIRLLYIKNHKLIPIPGRNNWEINNTDRPEIALVIH
jgi:hypothetical protein